MFYHRRLSILHDWPWPYSYDPRGRARYNLAYALIRASKIVRGVRQAEQRVNALDRR